MYPQAYVDYLVYFHGVRDYFECHEILEEEWKKAGIGERKPHWQGLIQIAVALYHWRRENFSGARKSLENAIRNLKNERKALSNLALDGDQMTALLNRLYHKIQKKKAYESVNLPIMDKSLIEACERLCKEKGCTMGNSSDLSDWQILH
ncbi:MAG TPA: DUF309 domain-containing protein, partial [Bacillales bacterium]